ncbi:MAG TPA: phosphoribosylformylglycinamidine synthase I [Actinobacteria bacterium]|nr:phosphoribosylformylglycinamidine synthase I [Actinomycetota bacterium]
MKKPRVCVLLAAGINRDYDAAYAFELAGAEAERVHVNELADRGKSLADYHILMLGGGFSFGDDIASGKVLANKLKYKLRDQIQRFIQDGKLVLGICNGFQVMVKFGLLPGFDGDYESQKVTLTFNDSGQFEDRWVYLKVNPDSRCIFTQGIDSLLYAPVCHGEGKFVPGGEEVLSRLHGDGQVVVQYVDEKGNPGDYPVNPNGSVDHIAGICDETGRLFGMMPHPEDFVRMTHHPRWTRESLPEEGAGLAIFRNALKYVQRELL